MDRFYVTQSGRRLRRYKVVGQSFALQEVPSERGISRRPRTHKRATVSYATASLHFTSKGARRAAKQRNREAGTAQ